MTESSRTESPAAASRPGVPGARDPQALRRANVRLGLILLAVAVFLALAFVLRVVLRG